MTFNRAAGILLHPTSLPGKFGVGDFGKAAYDFVNFLEVAGQTYWQILPLNPTGYGDSPYQSPSAFAGNTLMISPEKLLEDKLLNEEDLNDVPEFEKNLVDFEKVREFKNDIFRKAFINFKKLSNKTEFEKFCKKEKNWLDDYSLFIALNKHFDECEWTEWEEDIKNRTPKAIKHYSDLLEDEILYHKFLQYVFYKQWLQLKAYANKKGIKIIGDMPIFISFDSADVWANKELFLLTKDGEPKYVAGVPPDYFSETGQLWGNPHYDWEKMAEDDYKWWRERFRALLELVDVIRIDHFRGFYDYWQIPGNAENAIKGKWVKGPAEKFFDTIKKYFGDIPIIAEDLGQLHKGVYQLRDKYNFPGMKILQFSFGENSERLFREHNHIVNCVVYTGTHDNDTTLGWWHSISNEDKIWTLNYLGSSGNDIVYDIIKSALRSVAHTAIIPMQDYLRLGTEARMNFPSKLGGNWAWRFDWFDVPYSLNTEIHNLMKLYEREAKKKIKE